MNVMFIVVAFRKSFPQKGSPKGNIFGFNFQIDLFLYKIFYITVVKLGNGLNTRAVRARLIFSEKYFAHFLL
jgi:hypothetical protein